MELELKVAFLRNRKIHISHVSHLEILSNSVNSAFDPAVYEYVFQRGNHSNKKKFFVNLKICPLFDIRRVFLGTDAISLSMFDCMPFRLTAFSYKKLKIIFVISIEHIQVLIHFSSNSIYSVFYIDLNVFIYQSIFEFKIKPK